MINEYGSLNCKKGFVDDGSLFFFFSYLQPLSKYFQTFTSTDKNFGLKSKGLSEEIINSHAASENIFAPKLSFMTKKFEEKHLNKAKYQLVKKKCSNIFIAYAIRYMGKRCKHIFNTK